MSVESENTSGQTPEIAAGFAKMKIADARRHAFLCVGPDCCAHTDGLATWEVLKTRLNALGVPAMRTKAACLRVCRGGPWLVIYPEGVWYGDVTPERCERIVAEHLAEGRPIAEWIAQTQPLGPR
jgi:(2Fe-2S) ferredoxin